MKGEMRHQFRQGKKRVDTVCQRSELKGATKAIQWPTFTTEQSIYMQSSMQRDCFHNVAVLGFLFVFGFFHFFKYFLSLFYCCC